MTTSTFSRIGVVGRAPTGSRAHIRGRARPYMDSNLPIASSDIPVLCETFCHPLPALPGPLQSRARVPSDQLDEILCSSASKGIPT